MRADTEGTGKMFSDGDSWQKKETVGPEHQEHQKHSLVVDVLSLVLLCLLIAGASVMLASASDSQSVKSSIYLTGLVAGIGVIFSTIGRNVGD